MEPQLVFNASGNSCAPELGQVPDSQPGPGTFPALHPGGFSAPVVALLATLMALLVLTTVLGNALVILAFVVERSLRTQGNFFFLNLAIADLLVGGFCIPLYIPYVLTGEWKFGKGLCKLWLVVDYLVCTASVFNIVLISFDRFNSVTRAVTYRAQKGMTRNAVFKMLIVWLAAFLLYGPAIICWEYIARKSILPRGECYAEFYYNWYFLMIASTIEFFTPFISVSYFNLSIYISIRKRTLLRIDNLDSSRENCEMNLLEKRKGHVIFFIKPAEWNRKKKKEDGLFPNGSLGSKHDSPSSLDIQDAQDLPQNLPPLQIETKNKASQVYEATESICNATRHPDIARTMANRLRLSRDKRVAKSLAIIVCVFGLCWAPYTLLMIIRAMCHGTCVQHFFYEFSFWLLWLNSAINPALYPLCHVSFRKAFLKLLCPGKAKIHPHIFR